MKRFSCGVMIVTAMLAVSACSSDNGKSDAEKEAMLTVSEPPVEELYNKAFAELEEQNYKSAAKNFDEVERLYPYSEWATRAMLMSAFTQYKAMKYDEAVIALNRFIELHPGHKDTSYAYYLKGLCFYEQITDVGRDQAMTENAMLSLAEVTRRFPESQYARDAQLKIDLTRDHLAGKEMEIGRYYLKRGQYNAAINRFNNVIDDYQTTTQVAEALHRMVESYLALGLESEARRIASVLGHNYPSSEWYQRTYNLLGGKVSKMAEPSDESGSWFGWF